MEVVLRALALEVRGFTYEMTGRRMDDPLRSCSTFVTGFCVSQWISISGSLLRSSSAIAMSLSV